MESRFVARVRENVDQLAREHQQKPAAAGTLVDLEELTVQIGDEVTRLLTEQELQRRGREHRPCVADCPNCGQSCQPDRELESTVLEGMRGEVTRFADRNETVHAYRCDIRRQQTVVRITAVGSGVDDAVRWIETSYTQFHAIDNVTSYDADSGGNVLNQTQFACDGFHRVIRDFQQHEGAENTMTWPRAEYACANGTTDTTRRTLMTYPDGRVLLPAARRMSRRVIHCYWRKCADRKKERSYAWPGNSMLVRACRAAA